MSPHYHFYCDESGNFEQSLSRKKVVFGLLVPDGDRDFLTGQYTMLREKYLPGDNRPHGMDQFRNPDYRTFVSKLVNLTCHSSVKMVSMGYGHDVLSSASPDIAEGMACNRYLYMAQALIEQILYLHPPFWETSPRTFTFRPNSRVFPIRDPAVLDRLQSLGYHVFTGQDGSRFARVWDSHGFGIFLNRLMVDYAPFAPVTGDVRIVSSELLVAGKSDDPFVHWADALSGSFLWEKNSENGEKLRNHLAVDGEYGAAQIRYRQLVTAYLEKRFSVFLPEAVASVCTFDNAYYERCLVDLIDAAFNTQTMDAATFRSLAGIVTNHVETSSGHWDLVLTLTEKLLEKAGTMAPSSGLTADVRRLRAARLSCLNHRGDVRAALEIADELEKEPCITVDDLRERAEIRNRMAVTGANRFDFMAPAKALMPYLERLNNSRGELSRTADRELKDPLISRIASTAGQAFAFMAPIHNDHFVMAERLLKSALAETVHPDDELRQTLYLAHLYLDMDRVNFFPVLAETGEKPRIQNIGRDTVRRILARPDIREFVESPSPETPGHMAFVLSLLLKYELETGEQVFPDTPAWSDGRIDRIFPHNRHEHPFQFVWAYLAEGAYRRGRVADAEAFFNKALLIPSHIRTAPPVIKAIQCRFIGIWAKLLTVDRKTDEALEKINVLLYMMDQLAGNPENGTVITPDGSGWFGPSVSALKDAVRNRDGINRALSDFLNTFTFNYR
jgi:hypothetical protein